MRYLSIAAAAAPARFVHLPLPRTTVTAFATEAEEASQLQGKKSSAPGSGFGASSSRQTKKKAAKKLRNTASSSPADDAPQDIKRRPVPGKPLLAPPESSPGAGDQLETYFVYALFGLLAFILVEGLALAATGFLPEEWDSFFVKVVYPSFTPTVGLFVACGAGYGLYKYLGSQNQSEDS